MGIQGPAGTGMQGAGVGTPKAAAVNAITMGFAILLHMPKGKTFSMGTMAVILPAGVCANTLGVGKKINEEGATPMAQVASAPVTTSCPT
jgi:hypothetical protein